MKKRIVITSVCALALLSGWTIVSYNRAFPKLTWYWSKDAVEQRRERSAEKLGPPKQTVSTNQAVLWPGGTEMTPLAVKVQKRDGTNFLGVYLGMIAEWDGWTNEFNFNGERKPGPPFQGVMMFSATSGELLKWISAQDFTNIFVLKTQPEYPR